MLNNVKNRGKGHKYHKLQIAYLLILAYWKKINFCGYKMMLHNMGVFNEELGETTFSVLARCVLGDNVKNNREHMQNLFSMLSIYRDVKDDVLSDVSSNNNSISWRHNIDVNGEEVQNAKLFFKKMLRQIKAGTYKSYDGTPKSFKNAQQGSMSLQFSVTPLIQMTQSQLLSQFSDTIDEIKRDMSTYFVHPYNDIWPESMEEMKSHQDDIPIPQPIPAVEPDIVDDDIEAIPISPISQRTSSVIDDSIMESDDSFENVYPDDSDALLSPYYRRGWNAWGTIHSDNRMIGKRQRQQPARLLPSQRRLHMPNS